MHSTMNTDHTFHILNASAGSGKTYNLVKEYIKLIIGDEGNTRKFTQLIAMTFTNMAALEMKTRIMSSMDMLSNPLHFGKKAKDLGLRISEELKITEEEVYKRAALVMRQMLHGYEDFSVMTIDKFNLRLIRSFSRDLDLPADFDVVLNEDQVIEQVVDLLLSKLGSVEMADFTRIALRYSSENLEEGESWDFRKSLIGFSSNFSKEKDQQFLEKLIAEEITEDTITNIRQEIRQMEDNFAALAIEANRLLDSYGAETSSYPQGSNLVNRIRKMSGGLRLDTEAFSNTFKSVLANETPKGKFFPEELREVLIKADEFKDTFLNRYVLLVQYARNFYNIALLRFMAAAIDDMKKKDRVIRISEFNKLISTLVRHEEAPFIYERLGTRYQHFLLDEFQDTSRLQWLNMVPLIHNSLSEKKFNLIVGDPKQSIYRFKNGVAEQFIALPGIYNPENDSDITIKSNFFKQEGKVTPLPDNWRSSPEIVNTNNQLFLHLRELLPDHSREFYNSVEQVPQSQTSGLVSIRSYQGDGSQIELIRTEVLQLIQECLDDDFFKSDICVLTETNRTANEWALILKDAGHKVVSAESLLIDNDLKVNLVLSYLKIRLKPSVRSEMKKFAEIFFRIKEHNKFTNYSGYIRTATDDRGKTFTYFDSERFQIDHFGSANDFFRSYETLYDLIQGFFAAMEWNELKDPYLHHFADFVYDFEQAKGPDLGGLVELYEEKKGSLAIQTPVSDDAIIVMTIHKSKGLEFPVVIVPDLDFDTSVRNSARFLVQADELILHTNLSASSKISAVRDLHRHESEHILTDKMNLCYVALTRPEYRLYAFNPNNGKGFGQLFDKALNTMTGITTDNGITIYSAGNRSKRVPRQSSETVFFEPVDLKEKLWFPDIALMSSKNREEKGRSEERRYGNQLHLVLSETDNAEDIDEVLERLIRQGYIERTNEKRIREDFTRIYSMTEFIGILKHTEQILNERSIIIDEETTRRPDKVILRGNETVIIDFKTGNQKKEHFRQMEEYMSTYRQMGFSSVKGYILYTENLQLLECDQTV
jgi:ATP-dependent exoDNAse (exonuclease V) beta subunit